MTGKRYRAAIRPWQDGVAQDWCALGPAPSPFQSSNWYDTWYRSFADRDVEPLFVQVHEVETGASVYALPLVRHRADGLLVISFADLGVTDYNLPLAGETPPVGAEQCRAAWDAVSAILPHADLCKFEKMPERMGAHANPILAALGGNISHLFGNIIDMGDDLEAWRLTLHGHARAELRRFWRVFLKNWPDGRFVRARKLAEAEPILAWLEQMQEKRSRELGRSADEYLLDRPEYTGFYRALLRQGCESGKVVLTALMAGDSIVAASYALAQGSHFAGVRITHSHEYAACSPSRLLLERTFTALHAEGFRCFDLTTGDYPHKRSFEVRHLPLRDLTLARSIRGLPHSGLAITKAFVKQHPALASLARRLLEISGRKPRVAKPEAQKIAS